MEVIRFQKPRVIYETNGAGDGGRPAPRSSIVRNDLSSMVIVLSRSEHQTVLGRALRVHCVRGSPALKNWKLLLKSSL